MPFVEHFAEEKRIKLFERFILIATVIGIVHFVPDLFLGTKEAPIFDLIISVVSFFCYRLHRSGKRTLARVLAILFLNLLVTVYACVMDMEVGIYLFFLPLMALSMAVFGRTERLPRFLFTILSAVLLVALFLTDFNLIGSLQFETVNTETFFIINLFSCAAILIVCMHFIVGVNEESEMRLRALANEVNNKNMNLEKANSELDRFLYSTSHDLRAPLLSIKGLVNITRSEGISSEVAKYLAMIDERADRLDFFIKDIIDYSRNSRTDLSQDVVQLQQLVSEIQHNFLFLDGASGIDFQNEIIVEEVVVDRNRITMILNNLISNAIKYHRNDIPNRWIKTVVARSQNTLTVMVSDNGQGIQADRKSRIFEMFYRGTEQSQGSGIGLYIVKEAVDKMNGTISVESVENQGTTFLITLPLAETQTELSDKTLQSAANNGSAIRA